MSETSKKERTTSKTIRQIITKKPYEERIGTVDYTYSLVSKSTKSTSFFTNERLLILAGTKLIGYCRQLPEKTLLPFTNVNQIPPTKASIDLKDIIKVTTNKQVFTIQFQHGKNDQKWQFKCGSKDCADQWRRRIEIAIEMRKKQDDQGEPVVINDPTNHPPHTQQLTNQQNHPQNNITSPVKKEQQNSIKQPEVAYFIGGVAVNSEKEINEFKNQVSEIQRLNEEMKAQYDKKRKEQEQIKSQIENERDSERETPINNQTIQKINGMSTIVTDEKYILEKLSQNWSYQFAKGSNEYQIIDQFRAYLSILAKRIIDEYGLEQRKRYYQPFENNINVQKYQINSVLLEVINCQLKEVSSGYIDRQKTGGITGTVIANDYAKLKRQQLKNYDYILRLTNNKGRIRVPLTAIIQYKGFIVFAKAIAPYSQSYDSMERLKKQLDLLEVQSKISNSVFEDPECCKITPLNSKIFQKISRSENISKKYDICYIDDLKHYLPSDFTHFNKDKSYQKLRRQFVQDEQFDNLMLNGQNMATVMTRLKIPQNLKNGINQLTNICKSIPQRVELIKIKLEQLDEVFTNSGELSEIMHNHGVNIRYLGLLVEKVKQPWLKSILTSQIAARCAKQFLKFDLQDSMINLNEKSLSAVNKFQVRQVINFLNKMVGTGNQTDLFWKKLSKQAQTYYYVFLNKQQLNHGYLLQALIYHLRIKLKNLPPNIIFFKTIPNSHFFSEDQFQSFDVHFNSYDLQFTQFYKTVASHLDDFSRQSYEQLAVLLNLSRSSIPTHFKLSPYYDRIILYLSNWLSPQQGKNIYYPQQFQIGDVMPSKGLYRVKLTEVRWALKENNEVKSEVVRDWVVDHVNKWLGPYHPILTELYDIYSSYYSMKKDQQKKAVIYCKSSIKNQQKLITSNNVKLAEGYFQLGEIYLNYNRKIEALNTLKKAKDIFVHNNQTQIEAYGTVCLKMGQIYLALNQIKEAVSCGLDAVDQLSTGYQKVKFVQSIQLVCRCYEIIEDWSSYLQFVDDFLLERVKQFINESELLERVLKVIIYPILKEIGSHQSTSSVPRRILNILQQLPEGSRTPNIAFNYIRDRIQQKTMPQYFLEQLRDIQEVLQEIQNNGMLTRWKGFEAISNKTMLNKIGGSVKSRGFDFLANLAAISNFIGSSFIEGILMDH